MDRSNVCELVGVSYTADAIGQQVTVETPRTVFCNVQSVTGTEFFEAGKVGIRPSYRVTIFAPDYEGEEIVVLNGARYGVYRTYIRQDENIELYLEAKTGVKNVATESND